MSRVIRFALQAVILFSFAAQAQSKYSDEQALEILNQIEGNDYLIYPLSNSLETLVFKTRGGKFMKIHADLDKRLALQGDTKFIQIDIPGESSFYAYAHCAVDRTCGWDPSTRGSSEVSVRFNASPASLQEFIRARINQLASAQADASDSVLNRIKFARRKGSFDVNMAKSDAQKSIELLQNRIEALKHLRNWQGGNFVDSTNFDDAIADLELAKKMNGLF